MRSSLIASAALAVWSCSQSSPRSSPPAASPPDAAAQTAGDDDAGSLPAESGDDAPDSAPPRYPAFRPTMPVAASGGGRVLHAPRVFTITFDGDPYEAEIRAFDDGITSTGYWHATTAEYCDSTGCVGDGAGAGHATLPVPSSSALADDDMRALLAAHVADKSFAAPSEGSVYVFFMPQGISVTMPAAYGAGVSCSAFHAYHEHTTVKGPGGADADVAYAIIARCPDGSTFDAMSMLAGHELVEAATDPDLDGWTIPDPAWSTWHGNEVSDVCLGESTTKEGSWTLERSFSSAAAKAGKQPCVPATDDDEFGVAPRDLTPVRLRVGQSASIALVGYALAPGADWEVSVVDANRSGDVSTTLDRYSANDGTELTLEIALTQAPLWSPLTLLVRSRRGSHVEAWPLLVDTE